jgi:hypothetical protein
MNKGIVNKVVFCISTILIVLVSMWDTSSVDTNGVYPLTLTHFFQMTWLCWYGSAFLEYLIYLPTKKINTSLREETGDLENKENVSKKKEDDRSMARKPAKKQCSPLWKARTVRRNWYPV